MPSFLWSCHHNLARVTTHAQRNARSDRFRTLRRTWNGYCAIPCPSIDSQQRIRSRAASRGYLTGLLINQVDTAYVWPVGELDMAVKNETEVQKGWALSSLVLIIALILRMVIPELSLRSVLHTNTREGTSRLTCLVSPAVSCLVGGKST
jgi:hypothetical protein